jgi:hypothetical protein
VTLAVAAASLVIGATPALASGPKVPPGCSFDQATGVLTCATTTTTTSTAGPFSTNGPVPASTTFGGFTGTQICDFVFGGGNPGTVVLTGVTLSESITATTTTEQHGLRGKVFDTSSSTSPPSLTGVQGSLSCIA